MVLTNLITYHTLRGLREAVPVLSLSDLPAPALATPDLPPLSIRYSPMQLTAAMRMLDWIVKYMKTLDPPMKE
jgi:hypothetical protein